MKISVCTACNDRNDPPFLNALITVPVVIALRKTGRSQLAKWWPFFWIQAFRSG
jgi:hypothetical protein